ncbi:N-acetylmuramoyl-L-alanine amidase [Occultella kanbiaonis]|uniref:peptidoglycan recognition protein family protein n=1 Tax=Occultella kanbiaonis TaxID=2675754 RepID=UPI0013D35D2A|nr:N-acetylmuramoyl-L-alanine amidase [Occultella kanbiaonis]
MTYLETHKGPIAQWGKVRRHGAQPSGTTVLHTYEAPHVMTLNQAAMGIAYRHDRPASYHLLAGDDSARDVLPMAPWSAETWHETSTNNWGTGISMITYAGAWKGIPAKSADNLVKSAAYGSFLFATWLKANRGITIPARRITRAQALARVPGFIGHGEIDVGRRSDPGALFNWALFLDTYADLMGGAVTFTPSPEEDPDVAFTPAHSDQMNDIRSDVADIRKWLASIDQSESKIQQIYDRRTKFDQVPALVAQVAALTATVNTLAKNQGLDPEQLQAAIEKALGDITLTLTNAKD